MAKGVQYTAGADEIVVGSVVTASGDACAQLRRFGQNITTFLISPGQRRSLRKGKKITIHTGAIWGGDRYGCQLPTGGLRGARRRKRRR